jgi:chromosome partitioning protein
MIVATVNSKGGVGKSTIAGHLTLWLHEHGQRVALVDADFQNSSSQWIKEAAPTIPIYCLDDPNAIIKTINQQKRSYEHMILDGPAGTDEVTRALLLVADRALIPCGPSLFDVRAASLAVAVLESAQIIRNGKPEALFVCNKIRSHARLSRDLLSFAQTIGIPVARTALHYREVYADALTHKTAVWHLGYRAKEATQEISNLCQEVMNDGNSTELSGGAVA